MKKLEKQMQICRKSFLVENWQLEAPLIWSSQIANYELERRGVRNLNSEVMKIESSRFVCEIRSLEIQSVEKFEFQIELSGRSSIVKRQPLNFNRLG